MKTYVGLFRGINVGGKNTLPMAALMRELEAFSFQNIQTYIQSGNVVFQTDGDVDADTNNQIGAAIEKSHGFHPQVQLIESAAFHQIVNANPFPQANHQPKSMHISFLATKPAKPNLKKLEQLKSPTEAFKLIDCAFYLYAPNGIGRSKLAAAVEKNLGVSATGRNWNTVQKLLSMIEKS